MLVTSEMNKKSVEIVTEHFPRLPGNEIIIGELFHAGLSITYGISWFKLHNLFID